MERGKDHREAIVNDAVVMLKIVSKASSDLGSSDTESHTIYTNMIEKKE
jgi:hypothetical protein